MLTKLRDHFLRIDARSLGLYRIGLGATLLVDLFARWRWLVAFYSNDGVLPNHHHLFQLREVGEIWSIYHAFSSADEATTAFILTGLAYACFFIGWHTRVFAVVSAVLFVALEGRNSLTGDIGSSITIALLAPSIFLPLGARFSIDSLAASLGARDERTAEDLNDRTLPALVSLRPSLAALTLVITIGLVPLSAALLQNGATWQSGDALYYALHTDRWTSAIGVWLRERNSVLRPWTTLFRVAELAVLPLVLMPVVRLYARAIAIACLAFIGLTLTLLFDLGALGPCLLAGSAALIPSEAWDRACRRTRPIRLLYDDDCGMCLWLARLLKRLDCRHNVTFVPSSLEELPAGVDRAATEITMIVLDPAGRAHTDAGALAQVFRSLPLTTPLGIVIALPLVRSVVRAAYYRVASNRMRISEACGLGSCGLAARSVADVPDRAPTPPATRLARSIVLALESGIVFFLFLVLLAPSESMNPVTAPLHLRDKAVLASAARWARFTAPWGLFAPEPPRVNEALVVEAETRDGTIYDVLSGKAPDLDLRDPAQHRLGTLWSTYAASVRNDEHSAYRPELRRYLMRGGVPSDSGKPVPNISRIKAWWLGAPIPAPGQARTGEVTRSDILDGSALRTTTPLDDPSRVRPRLKPDLRQLR